MAEIEDISQLKKTIKDEIQQYQNQINDIKETANKKVSMINDKISSLKQKLEKYNKNPYIVYNGHYLRLTSTNKEGVVGTPSYVYCKEAQFNRYETGETRSIFIGKCCSLEKGHYTFHDDLYYYTYVKIDVLDKEEFQQALNDLLLKESKCFENIN